MRVLPWVLVAVMALSASCAPGGVSRQARPPDRNVITRLELEAIPPTSAFQAIARLRALWLRGYPGTFQGDRARDYPYVFLDGRPHGTLDSLHQIGTEVIESIRFLSASDATTRFGTGYPAGIIEITTRHGKGLKPPGTSVRSG